MFFSLVGVVTGYPTAPIERIVDGSRPGDRVEHTVVDLRSNRRVMQVDHNNVAGNGVDGIRYPIHDASGNLLDDGNGRKYVYDAGGKLLAAYAYATNAVAGPGFWEASKITPVAIYGYDPLGRLARADFNTNGDDSIDARDWREEYGYDHLWRLTTIWRQGPGAEGGQEEGSRPARQLYQQYVHVMGGFGGWGADLTRNRLDSVVCRYRDTDGDGEMDEVLYYVMNWRGDVTAIWEPGVKGVTMDDESTVSRAVVRERIRYSAWGIPTSISASDINWDG